MKTISRDAIQRMTGSGSSGVSVGGGGGASIDLTGYATEMWTEENYVGKEFFSSLFKAYDANGTEVLPNDTTTTIDNIKAMFGFWTEFYISALGTGGQSTVGLRLSQLADVNVAGVQNDQVLKYDATSQKWVPGTASSGTDMTTVWANLAAATNEQINYSHLSNAVKFGTAGNDYIPITIGSTTKNVLTNHQSLSGYATQSWANGQFLKLSGGTMTGAITMKANQYSDNYGLNMNNSDIIGANSIYTADLSDDWTEGLLFKRTNGNWDSFRAANGDFYMNNNSGNDGACLHVSRLVLSCTNDSQGTANNNPALVIGGTPTTSHVEIDSNEIMAKSNASTTTTLYLNAEGGNCIINESSGNCGIGTGSPSHKLHVSGGIYATSYVTALSDIRKKDVVSDFELRVADIAGASLIRFTWKDKHDTDIHAGGIAQEWKRLLPESVREDADDTLSMDYGVIAVAASVSIARRVVAQDRVIKAQSKKINALEKRLARIEKMFALNDNDLED